MYCGGGQPQVPGPEHTWLVPKLMCHTDVRAGKKSLVLQVSCRSSECDRNHIFLIYSYILYVVAAIPHMRGMQRSLLSQSKRHRSQFKTHREFTIAHNFMLEFNIIPCSTDFTFFPDSSGRRSILPSPRQSNITPHSHLVIHVSLKLKHV